MIILLCLYSYNESQIAVSFDVGCYGYSGSRSTSTSFNHLLILANIEVDNIYFYRYLAMYALEVEARSNNDKEVDNIRDKSNR